jgi:hypothetical protein
VDKAKPFDIPKLEVWEAFKKVKANQGVSCPRFFWTPICPTGGRYGEVQHEQNHTQ